MNESEISIVMPVYNSEAYLSESIESVLKQSYDNFELLIIDDGSTDRSSEIIQSYYDNRIKVFRNTHNLVGALNKGLSEASGKYIARMDADDIMHTDRLKIQYSIMEEAPEITVCGTWMTLFGEKIRPGTASKGISGLIQSPLIQFIKGNIISHPTTIIRRNFLLDHKLRYESYGCAEDYKLWFEIAKRKGVFYIESQSLLYYRVSETQVSQSQHEKQRETNRKIKEEVLEYIINQNTLKYPQIDGIYKNMIALERQGLINFEDICSFYYSFFFRYRNELKDL